MIDYIKILKIIRNKAYTSTDQFKYEEQQYIDKNYPKRFVSDREKMAKLTYLAIFFGINRYRVNNNMVPHYVRLRS